MKGKYLLSARERGNERKIPDGVYDRKEKHIGKKKIRENTYDV
jgi:hypothetical protein